VAWVIVVVPVDDEATKQHRVLGDRRYTKAKEARDHLPQAIAESGYVDQNYNSEKGFWEANDPVNGRRFRFWTMLL
jgi:hypothetical protein